MFSEERNSWEQEMLIREAVENAEQGFTVCLKNGSRIFITKNSPTINIIIYGIEKAIRCNYGSNRLTFIDFLYYWHERIFKQIKRKSQVNK